MTPKRASHSGRARISAEAKKTKQQVAPGPTGQTTSSVRAHRKTTKPSAQATRTLRDRPMDDHRTKERTPSATSQLSNSSTATLLSWAGNQYQLTDTPTGTPASEARQQTETPSPSDSAILEQLRVITEEHVAKSKPKPPKPPHKPQVLHQPLAQSHMNSTRDCPLTFQVAAVVHERPRSPADRSPEVGLALPEAQRLPSPVVVLEDVMLRWEGHIRTSTPAVSIENLPNILDPPRGLEQSPPGYEAKGLSRSSSPGSSGSTRDSSVTLSTVPPKGRSGDHHTTSHDQQRAPRHRNGSFSRAAQMDSASRPTVNLERPQRQTAPRDHSQDNDSHSGSSTVVAPIIRVLHGLQCRSPRPVLRTFSLDPMSNGLRFVHRRMPDEPVTI